jgi:hypothetical protein
MRPCWKGWVAALALTAPMAGSAATCTTQGEMQPADRNALIASGQSLTTAILQENYSALQADVFPAVASDWNGIRGEVEQGAPLLKGGEAQLQAIYLLDASSQTAVGDTEFFCSNTSGSLTVTISMHALPPGKYAVLLATAVGAPMGGQIGIVVVWDPTGVTPGWKIGGLSIRQGIIDGHDGVWYWSHGRALAGTGAPWSAYYSYDMARYLLLPVDFISSPNMEKLVREQGQIQGGPGVFPISIVDGARTWKIDGMRVDSSLRQADLGVTYESLGIADPAATRTEAVAVMSALLKAHPDLRENFHGLWAYASKDGKVSPVIELPMAQIP